MYQDSNIVSILSGYDVSNGSSTTALPSPFKKFQFVSLQFENYGFDAADATATLQGSFDNLIWTNVLAGVTFGASIDYAVDIFALSTGVIVAGNATANLVDGQTFYIVGSITNDGRRVIVSSVLLKKITYINLMGGSLNVGDTITADNGNTGTIIAKSGGSLIYVSPIVGNFGASASFTDDQTGATADINALADVTSITTAETNTVEAGAGDVFVAATKIIIGLTTQTAFLYYRVSFVVNSVTTGFIDANAFAKTYNAELDRNFTPQP